MRSMILLPFLLLNINANGQTYIDNAKGQTFIEPSKLTLIPYKPSILGVNSDNQISLGKVFENGLTVVLADTTFKVIQFDVVYDCHSRSVLDFSVMRYTGNKVEGTDKYLRMRVLAGDVMDISNTVIEKHGVRFRMKDYSFIVTK